MIPKHRTPTPLGEILVEEFLRPLGLTQTAFARHLGVPVRRVNEIVRGRRAVSPETAQLFAAALGTSPEFCDRGDHGASHTDLLQEAYVSGLPPWRGMRLSGESGRSHGKATGA